MGQKKHKRKSRKCKNHSGLQGIPASLDKERIWEAVKGGGLLVLTAFGGSLLGAAVGRHSLLFGAPITIAGKYMDNDYLLAVGLGMSMSNGFQTPVKPLNGMDDANGFDVKQIAQDAKDRVGKFFENFKDKLYIPADDAGDAKQGAAGASSNTGTNGLGASDNVQYFINPMSTKDLDLSAMERVEQQVAALNRGTNGIEDIDREF
ncbi:MAG TPA: hypothetical protein VIN08_20350 [Ohtaekwangia sp.]|uniref:hypothetical protein n=1 Tax=Ohtaekwangia sp. TaxID=2066019 RepID=UPI002F921995